MLVTVIGRGHSGTRAMSHTLSASGVYMGQPLNGSGDLLPPEQMYEACRVFAKFVDYKGGLEWDFSRALGMEPTPDFKELITGYLADVLNSQSENKGWKIPETTLVYPWIVKMFPDIKYIHWVRDPRDCILNSHVTDDMRTFDIDYPPTDDIREKRAYSWKYQRDIMRATPEPAHCLKLRFEDMVFKQEQTLAKLEAYLGIKMCRIEMRTDPVGRYKAAEGKYMFDFFEEEMKELGYEF